MGMSIYNNLAAMSALHENNRNEKNLSKILKQAASGMKINSAGDDASGYAISEKMRIKLRALGQCKENSLKGKDMIETASAAVDQQVNIMKQVKTVALRATDDTYTDKDRENLQKEVGQLLDQSEDIANTKFNGIDLLNQRSVSKITKWFDSAAPYRTNPNNTPVLKQAANSNCQVDPGVYVDIDANTALYDPASKQAGSALTSMPSNGAWVWDNAANDVAQVFHDTNDDSWHLGSLTGTLIEIAGVANPPGSTPAANTNVSRAELKKLQGLPNIGDKVSNSASYPATNSFDVKTDLFTNKLSYFDNSTLHGSDYIADMDLSALPGSIANVPKDLDGLGFSFNCGACDQFVTVMFDANASDTKRYEGTTGNPPPLCYVVGVSNVTTAPSLEASLGEAIFNGISAVTKYNGGSSLPSANDESVGIADRHDITLNYYAATGKFSITKSGPSITLMNGLRGEMKETDSYKPEQKLYLQTADKASQNTRIVLPNTTLSMLFPDSKQNWDIFPSEEDYPKEWPKGYDTLSDAQKREKWKDEVWQYPKETVRLDTSTCVSTREKANVFLDNVDQAIKYLLNANTALGAQSNRLDFTQENLVTMHENTTSAESVIRDADMAKIMMSYAKYNILSQGSQSMLAQANQTPQSVLSLLQ